MSADADIRSYVDRLVRIETERRELAKDAKAVRDEAKSAGFSPKLIATCVRIMLMEAEKRAEALSGHEELDLYLSAVGLVAERVDHETRQDAGGSGYAGPAMAARAAARDEAGADVIRETDASVSATETRQSGGSRPEQAASCNAPGAGEGGREAAQGYSAATEAPWESGSRIGERNAAACRDGAGASAEPGRNRGHLADASLTARGSSSLPATGREEGRHPHSDHRP
ncbi:GapR family DNA-binding domain-containing protein [Methylobacterium fujisawaense]|uniref:GapR family DNA-binding domain-containing protein n=1 Tax=Methylobacterium fujisawaense TaxID=107400 RepID=UPI003D01C249